MAKMKTAPSAGPLFFVGLGLCDEEDLSYRASEVLRGCSHVFAESYTNLMREGTLERLGKKIGRKIVKLTREEVEDEKIILEACASGPVALLVPGDPMTATTHISLREAAEKTGIETHILHAASIFSAAAGAAGLQIYKFGKTATITFWRKNFEPTSFIDLILENQQRGAHTLCLLDIDSGGMGAMKASLALDLLEKAQQKRGSETGGHEVVLKPDTPLFVLWHVGWPDQKIWAGKRKEWPYANGEAKGSAKAGLEPAGPAVILIPGKMHFVEEECWERIRKSENLG